ncbi:uracil-DNA glycosylase [bacterium]|nr:uracil-DNA glycosylase [bacterium]
MSSKIIIDEKVTTFNQISDEIISCRKCILCESAKLAVVGEGSLNSKIIFIGEAPGKNEDETGEDVWIGNVIKHRPPKNRPPKSEEIFACKNFLTRQIELINPQIIVSLGRFSFNYFLPDAKITSERGKLIDMGRFKLFPVYHPAAALRNKNFLNTLTADFSHLSEILEKNIREKK